MEFVKDWNRNRMWNYNKKHVGIKGIGRSINVSVLNWYLEFKIQDPNLQVHL